MYPTVINGCVETSKVGHRAGLSAVGNRRGSRFSLNGQARVGPCPLFGWAEPMPRLRSSYFPLGATASEATLEASKKRFSNVRNRRNPSAFAKTLNPLSLDETANRSVIAQVPLHARCSSARRSRRLPHVWRCWALLAVSSSDNGFKVLTNADGLRLLRTFENRSFDASRVASEAVAKNGDSRNLGDVKARVAEDSPDKSKIWKLTEISIALLALVSNAFHLLWKWQRNDWNTSGKATASIPPQLWQPPSGIMMTNDVTDTNHEEAVPCFALSKNDSYLMSASGGKISLFNMMTFKKMTTFMPPPPAATFLAFHPQDNNIIAIGMDDSTIQIYNVRVDEVKSKLKGHSKRITGLAFSNSLNVLVSSGADAQVTRVISFLLRLQICVWGTDGWDKQRSRSLQVPAGRTPAPLAETRVQFHQDQTHFLVVHETQIAIYETTKLECVKQWIPRESSAPISHATFSFDSQLVYVTFVDSAICVFNAANLRLRCRINPTAYLSANAR
ncbi:Topless-related protein 1 [Nymphaea thermarum]|nr:Topless-related protein 1 [Nymphaea thermarum]